MLPKVLIIDNDPNSVRDLQYVLEAEGTQVLTTATGQAGIALAQLHHPNLVLLDIDLPDMDGYAVCRALRAASPTAKLPLLIHSARAEVADKVAGFKAGANDYIVKPVAPAELIARIKAALRSEEPPALAHVVALWGAKGGVGTTTIATNLALALKSKTGQRVILLDASVLGGTLQVMLNLPPHRTIADLLPRLDDLDSELLGWVLAKHSSGIKVLLSVPWSRNGSSVQPAQLERIMAWLQEASDYIIIDTAPSLDPSTVSALQLSNQVAVVLTPEMTALRNARLFLKMAQAWQRSPGHFVLTLNRYPVKGCVSLKDVESALQSRVDVQIANDDALVAYSINRGVPLVVSHPRSPVAQGFYQLAERVTTAAQPDQRMAVKSTAPG